MVRRKYHRIGTDQVISFAPMGKFDATRDAHRLAVGKDVSKGGIRFEAMGCEFEMEEVLRVTFNLGERTVVAIGRIVWATDTDPITTEYGIEFVEIEDEALRLLESVLAEDSAA